MFTAELNVSISRTMQSAVFQTYAVTVAMSTLGDKILDTALSKVSLFVLKISSRLFQTCLIHELQDFEMPLPACSKTNKNNELHAIMFSLFVFHSLPILSLNKCSKTLGGFGRWVQAGVRFNRRKRFKFQRINQWQLINGEGSSDVILSQLFHNHPIVVIRADRDLIIRFHGM